MAINSLSPEWNIEAKANNWGTLPNCDNSSIDTGLVAWGKFQNLT